MQKEKILWIDYLRVLATFSVVFLHTSIPLLDKFDSAPDIFLKWWIGNIYDSSVRFCVPVFIMITGALLLNKEIPLKLFLKRRFTRILLPFVFWNLVYLFLRYDHREHAGVMDVLQWGYNLLLTDAVSYHLWFVYVLIGLYLFIPILNKWISHCTEREMEYFLIIWVFTLLIRYPFLPMLRSFVDLSYFSGYIGYLVLGYYLSVKKIK